MIREAADFNTIVRYDFFQIRIWDRERSEKIAPTNSIMS
jgi:hypothetical protein